MRNSDEPIDGCIARWHQHVHGTLPGGLDSLLHEECVFLSPIVFTPQRGREITKLYLRAAGNTLTDAFRYTTEIRRGHHAMLEFETEVDGKYANGVDIITCDDDGMIVEFTVMMRPLQAIHAVHAQMKAMLEQLSS